jgi:hypothetical protein
MTDHPMPDAEQPTEGSHVELSQLVGRQITGLTPDGKALTLGAFAGSGEITLTWDWISDNAMGIPDDQLRLYAYWSKK